MRTKRRYIAFDVIGQGRLTRGEVIDSLVGSHLSFVGERDYSVSSPWLISFDEGSQRGIVRTNLDGLHQLRASMALINEVRGKRVIFRTLGLSGTIRSCEDRFIKK